MILDNNSSKMLSFFTWLQVVFVLLMIIQPLKTAMGQDLTVNPTFANNITAAQQAVIQQAINEWHVVIESRGINPANLPVTFQNGPLAGNTLANTRNTFNSQTGAIIRATVNFDNDGSTTWFIDPTPNNTLDDTIPTGQVDYLSVARHEIGHALGFFTGANTAANPFVSGNTFDVNRLNIRITGNHTAAAAHPNDIMNPAISATQRREISLYPSASFIARAYQCDITMTFVDSINSGTETGSATDPWNTVAEGLQLTPVGRTILLIPGSYKAPAFIHKLPITLNVARGGEAVIK